MKKREKHGKTKSREYETWCRMKQRCLNKNNRGYKNYGGRGIKICEHWMEFSNFYDDMGDRPENKSLDRVNNNGNYEPGNCRWATRSEQGNNQRTNRLITYKGKTQTLKQWSKELGINYLTLYTRIVTYGWSAKKAFLTKVCA